MNHGDRSGETRLLAAETDQPGLELLLDDDALCGWAAAHGVGLPVGTRVDRLRHKPGTRAQAAVDPGDGSSWWLLNSYSSRAWVKSGKDLRAATASAGVVSAGAERVVVDEERRVTLVPAGADRDLPALPAVLAEPGVRFLAHNPARRAVLRVGSEIVKVHADPTVAPRSARAAGAVRAAGGRTPGTRCPNPFVARTAFLPGRHPEPGAESTAVLAELAEFSSRVDPTGLPMSSVEDLHAGAVAGLTVFAAWAALEPELRERIEGFAEMLRRNGPGDPRRFRTGFLHGDLSADQVLLGPHGPVLLDLDRAGAGPVGLDPASWVAADVAAGRIPPSSAGIDPLLLVVAAVARLPEPFRRRRPDWPERTAALLDLVSGALGVSPVVGVAPC